MRTEKMDIYSKDVLTGEMRRIGSIPVNAWIMTLDQQNRLTELAREIAEQDGVTVSITLAHGYVSMHCSFLPDTDIAEQQEAQTPTPDDPIKRLALEVSKMNGYALGAFMQHLMKFGQIEQDEL